MTINGSPPVSILAQFTDGKNIEPKKHNTCQRKRQRLIHSALKQLFDENCQSDVLYIFTIVRQISRLTIKILLDLEHNRATHTNEQLYSQFVRNKKV